MKANNNAQKLFTTSQLIAVITFTAVIATLVVLWITKDFGSFANHIQG